MAGEQSAIRNPQSAIFLVGFMGAGKTTVGRALAGALGYTFFDLDELIEARAGRAVRDIFAEAGEAEFRRLESEAITACAGLNRTVVALGGGAYVSAGNRALLRRLGVTVWLDCPLEVCLARVAGDGTRPLLAGEHKMRELLEQRRPGYAQADYTLRVGDLSAAAVAGQIIRLLTARG